MVIGLEDLPLSRQAGRVDRRPQIFRFVTATDENGGMTVGLKDGRTGLRRPRLHQNHFVDVTRMVLMGANWIRRTDRQQRDRPIGDVIAAPINANDDVYDQEPLAAVA